jgi:hypothetical protein
MNYKDVLSMPLRTFWMMNKNIDRIMAEADMRMLSVVAYAQSGDGIEDFTKKLRDQVGKIVEIDAAKMAMSETYDREGLLALKALV